MKENMISTRQLIAVVWQKKWLVAICAVLCVVLALVMTVLCMTPVYEATAVFYVQGENAAVLAESSIYLLQTRQTLDAILEYAGPDCSRDQLRDMLSTEIMGQTPLLEVAVTGTDAAQTKRIADAVAEVLPRRLAEVIPGSRMDVADAPELPVTALKPSYLLYALIGLCIGLALPVGVIVIRQYWNATV